MMSVVTATDKRDRALIAFTLLTGARDSAIASMKIKHIDFTTDTVFQDAREANGVDLGIDFIELKEKDVDALFNEFTGLASGLQVSIEADFHNNAAL